METKEITTLDELREIAMEVLELCKAGEKGVVIALTGDLGVGKTAFTKALGKILGIREEITSPTFVIMKSYEIGDHPFFTVLTHIDAYRIESDDEMRVLNYEELLRDPKRIICIEWPEKIQNLIPHDAQVVSFTLQGETRTITYGN